MDYCFSYTEVNWPDLAMGTKFTNKVTKKKKKPTTNNTRVPVGIL